MIQIGNIVVIMVLLISCGVTDPDDTLEADPSGTIYIEYNGMVATESSLTPSFSLVNDSTVTIQYFGYSKINPLFNAEAKTDTGWTHLMWGWCGTGADYFALDPDSSVTFLGLLPSYSCTYRLVLDIIELDTSTSRQIRSESIDFTLSSE